MLVVLVALVIRRPHQMRRAQTAVPVAQVAPVVMPIVRLRQRVMAAPAAPVARAVTVHRALQALTVALAVTVALAAPVVLQRGCERWSPEPRWW